MQIQQRNNKATVFMYHLICMLMASKAETCSVKWIIRRDKEPSKCEFNTWAKLHRGGEVRVLKLEYTMQQDATIQYYSITVFTHLIYALHNLQTTLLLDKKYQKELNSIFLPPAFSHYILINHLCITCQSDRLGILALELPQPKRSVRC
jgi:hypothetical protein